MSKELSEGQNFTIGTIAAFVEGVLLQPTLYWKNAKAQKLPFTLDPRLLYRGTAASIFNEMQMMGVQFLLTGLFEKIFSKNNSQIESSAADSATSTNKFGINKEAFLSAGLGGMFSAAFSSPIELIMIQQQKHGGSFFSTPARVIRTHGFMSQGIMRGVIAAAGRDSLYTVGMLGITPLLQNFLQEEYKMSLASASFAASMVGGVLAAVPSHPFDVIKTCMQGDLEQTTYRGFAHTLRALLREEGVSRLLHGVGWRTVNITATVYIANEVRNRLTPFVVQYDF
eukprot:gene28721-34672_t